MAILKARPSESEKEPLLVFLTAVRMLDLKLTNGDLCHLNSSGSENGKHAAVAWTSSRSDMKDGLVGISKWFQERSQIKLGSEVSIVKSDVFTNGASNIRLHPKDLDTSNNAAQHWAYIARLVLPEQHRYLAPGQTVFLSVGKHRYEFEVASQENEIYKITDRTEFRIDESTHEGQDIQHGFMWTGVGGISEQINTIERFIQQLLLRQQQWLPGFAPRHGLLFYGPKGTGKTVSRHIIAQAKCWTSVERWKPNLKIRSAMEPRLIQIDLHDKLSLPAVIELLEMFESIKGSATLILGEAEHPNDIDKRLRSVNAFNTEVEFPVPNVSQREQILSVLSQNHLNGQLLIAAAEKTHGYVGEDLQRLLNAMWDSVLSRTRPQENGVKSIEVKVNNDTSKDTIPNFEIEDFDNAIIHVRPSALQEVFLEKPNVRWNDIGGQNDIKQDLQNAIEWPLKYPQKMARMGLDSTKGVLLYGPPGCSKTLLVKALANEADVNFLAVKGAELISMYVGESERATREVFRKARAASPCIIFFDEIDAIASRNKSGSDLNVLTTLLNEMDGFEELRNVLVVAATNKPQFIDPALMRPGRFDNVVYIGPPDTQTRKEILRQRFERFSYDETVKSKLDEYAVQTHGFSGAEVVAVCKTAAKHAFSAGREVVMPEDMDIAVKATPKSITAEMLAEYESWNAARR